MQVIIILCAHQSRCSMSSRTYVTGWTVSPQGGAGRWRSAPCQNHRREYCNDCCEKEQRNLCTELTNTSTLDHRHPFLPVVRVDLLHPVAKVGGLEHTRVDHEDSTRNLQTYSTGILVLFGSMSLGTIEVDSFPEAGNCLYREVSSLSLGDQVILSINWTIRGSICRPARIPSTEPIALSFVYWRQQVLFSTRLCVKTSNKPFYPLMFLYHASATVYPTRACPKLLEIIHGRWGFSQSFTDSVATRYVVSGWFNILIASEVIVWNITIQHRVFNIIESWVCSSKILDWV
jgi:hypothetical protein